MSKGAQGKRLLRVAFAGSVLLTIGGLVAWGLAPGDTSIPTQRAAPDDDDPDKPDSGTNAPLPERTVRLDSEVRRKGAIETIAPDRIVHEEQIRAYGTVVDLDALVSLHASYINAKAQLDTARARLVASQSTYERIKTLYGGRTMSLAQLQTAEANYRADQSAVVAAESQLRTLAATAKEEWGSELGGALVESGPLINALIDREKLLVQITRRASDSHGRQVSPTTEIAAGGMKAEARFLSLATQSDPKIQGQSFYYTVPASSGLLPGMSVIASLSSGRSIEAYRVPSSAGVWWDGRMWAYVQSAPGQFTRRPLSADLPTADDGALIVPAGDFPQAAPTIVVKGAQALLSEEFRSQIQIEDDD